MSKSEVPRPVEFIFALLLCSQYCNALKGRIVGGKVCTDEKHEFTVAIVDRSFNVKCGGSLLESRWVLTAAHCCGDLVRIRYVLAGISINPVSEYISDSVTVAIIEKCITHPEYDQDDLVNDIALLRLNKNVRETATISYVALPTSKLQDDIHKWCTQALVLGWGWLDYYSRKKPSKLHCVTLDVIPTDDCLSIYHSSRDPDTVLCTWNKDKDACRGDSGGPLICNGIQYGIVSFGLKCATQYPGVYTRVDNYLDYIGAQRASYRGGSVAIQAVAVNIILCIVCTSSKGKKDACRGDSGGPMICRGVQYGIISFGILCGEHPGVHTRVDNYLDFIHTTIITQQSATHLNRTVILLLVICMNILLLL